MLLGKPSVGKTWFATILGKLIINTGYIGNSNRSAQFQFQDCPRRNLLIFDEPNVEPAAFETFKLIFTGTPCPANIKYENKNLINRTPVVVLCNIDPFPDCMKRTWCRCLVPATPSCLPIWRSTIRRCLRHTSSATLFSTRKKLYLILYKNNVLINCLFNSLHVYFGFIPITLLLYHMPTPVGRLPQGIFDSTLITSCV